MATSWLGAVRTTVRRPFAVHASNSSRNVCGYWQIRRIGLFSIQSSTFRPNSSLNCDKSCHVHVHCQSQSFSSTSDADLTTFEAQSEKIIQLAQQGDPVKAQKLLDSLQETKNRNSNSVAPSPCYSALIRSWLDHSANSSDKDTKYDSILKVHALLGQLVVHDPSKSLQEQQQATARDNNVFHLVLEHLSSIASHNHSNKKYKGIPQRAQLTLEWMTKSTPDLITIETYNLVLSTWASTSLGPPDLHLAGARAQSLYDALIARDNKITKPNADTFRFMIYIWTSSCRYEGKAAFYATGHLRTMIRMLRQDIDEQRKYNNDENSTVSSDWEPTMDIYMKIFQAWETASNKNKADRAISLFDIMEDLYIQRYSEVRPTFEIYKSIITTFANSPHPMPENQVSKLLDTMYDRSMVPDTECFDQAFRYFQKAAQDNKNNAPHEMAKASSKWLSGMWIATQKSANVQVTTQHYNRVLQAHKMAVENDHKNSNRNRNDTILLKEANRLLTEMEESSEDSLIRPTAESYACVMTIAAQCFSLTKLQDGQDLMQRAQVESSRDTSSTLAAAAAKPTTELYNAFIQLCASCTNIEEDKEEAFRVALSTWEDMRSNSDVGKVNSQTFQGLLEASSCLLPIGGNIQRKAMEHIFIQCCQAGMLQKSLLVRFKEVAPFDLYNRLVEEMADNIDGRKVLPAKWTLVKSNHLGLDGSSVATQKRRDKQTYKLRNRIGQKLLQGGRLTKDQMLQMTTSCRGSLRTPTSNDASDIATI